jgi:hypothetical protein
VHELDGDAHGQGGFPGRPGEVAGRDRGERPEPLARGERRVLDRAQEGGGPGRRRGQRAAKGLLDRSPRLGREAAEGAFARVQRNPEAPT